MPPRIHLVCPRCGTALTADPVEPTQVVYVLCLRCLADQLRRAGSSGVPASHEAPEAEQDS